MVLLRTRPVHIYCRTSMIRASWGQSLDAELDRQRDAMRELGFSDDYREGVAAFMEKRTPNFRGR